MTRLQNVFGAKMEFFKEGANDKLSGMMQEAIHKCGELVKTSVGGFVDRIRPMLNNVFKELEAHLQLRDTRIAHLEGLTAAVCPMR